MAAQDISGLTSIRSDLNAKGITNDRIGYNNKTGMVTIDGQDFLHPSTAVGGTSYADPTSYNNAYNIFNAGQQQQAAQQKASTAEQNYLQALNTPAINPYDQQVSSTLSQLMQRLNNPTPYDVYSSPEYAAQQAQAQKGAQQSVRQAQESLGASGLGRSSVLSDRAQGIQNDANAYLQTQVIPQLQQQHQAQEQQQLANLSSLLSALSGQQGVYDTRNQNRQSALGQLLDYTTGRADAAQQQVAQAQQQAYQTARDSIADRQYQQQFDENVRQFGLQQALQQAQLDHQISNDNAQLAISRMNAQTSAASAANAARNAAADNQLARERFDFEKQQAANPSSGGLSTADMQKEASAMLSSLRSGQITPQAALAQIADDESLGIYSQDNADYLRSQISRVAPEVPKVTATPEQVQAAQANMPSDKEIEDEARSKGYALLDYRSWYKSPDGRLAGLDYPTWEKLYGPRITAG